MANIRRSIELEPRTLSQGQLSHAKKVAADVVQKLEPREASSVFTEGLVHSVKEVKEIDEDGGQVEKEVGCVEKVEIIDEKACMCLCSTAKDESPDQIRQNEPLSAPF